MQTFDEVLEHFCGFLESARYLKIVPCRWGYIRLFYEGDKINFEAILCRTPEELDEVLSNDFSTELELGQDITKNHLISVKLSCFSFRFKAVTVSNML